MNSNISSSGSFLPPSGSSSSIPHQHRTVRYQLDHDDRPSLHSTTSTLYKILSSLATFIIITLCTIGLATTLFVLYLTIRPFSLPTYRRLACNIGAAALLDAMALLLPNMRIYLTGDSDPLSPVGVSFLVCNHVMEGDWWAMLMMARCVGLRGSVKAFLQRRPNSNGINMKSGGVVSHSPNGNSTGNLNGTSNNGTDNMTMHMSSSASLLNSSSHHYQHPNNGGGFKRNLSQQGVSNPTNNNPHSQNQEKNIIGNGNGNSNRTTTKPCSSLAVSFLHSLLEFPLLSSEHTQNYIADRNELFTLLRSFASDGAPAPIHLLLFPEGCSEGDDRKSMMTKSMEFAKREGRPQLNHLLLPRTTGFYASLDSLREASPVVYDVTMAYRGYDGGENSFSCDISLATIMKLIRGEIPNEVYMRIKRFSMEEVLGDAQWLDKQWSEKDRLLGKFVRCGNFASVDNRGFCRYRVLDTRCHSVESSLTALIRLGLIPFAIPVILFLFVPLLWGVGWVWLAHRSFLLLFPGGIGELIGGTGIGNVCGYGRGANMSKEEVSENHDDNSNHEGTDSAVGTPFFPATPFASPINVANWRATHVTSSKDSDSPTGGRR
mmetsp:Transcript_19605/g.24174  ORF Transcript_19605/g.24174 Transcript_19605/m.24174 type:complete len:603 (+) Transcript_19605:138-1946(+)